MSRDRGESEGDVLEAVLGLEDDTLSYGRVVRALRVGAEDAAFESERLDFKSALPKNEELARAIVSFANAGGGVLVLGVRDENEQAAEETPVELGAPITARMQSVTEIVDPTVSGLLYRELPREGASTRGLVVIAVPSSPQLPHAVAGPKGRRAYFIRVHRETRPMGDAELEQAFLARRDGRALPLEELVRVHLSGTAFRGHLDVWAQTMGTKPVSLVEMEAVFKGGDRSSIGPGFIAPQLLEPGWQEEDGTHLREIGSIEADMLARRHSDGDELTGLWFKTSEGEEFVVEIHDELLWKKVFKSHVGSKAT